MPRIRDKWRPSLRMVLGGALAATLALSLIGLVVLRYLGPAIGFMQAAIIVAAVIGLATLVLAALLTRLLLRPIQTLSERSAAIRRGDAPVAPLAHYGTRELRDMGQTVLDMADTLRHREASIRSYTDHVTHELKTPVSTIRAASEMLSDSAALSPEDRRLVSQIEAACNQMQTQLDSARRMAAARAPGHDGVSTLTQGAAPLAANFPTLDIAISGHGFAMPMAAEGLSIILTHLLDNAARHGATQVSIAASGNGIMTVADDGSGISPGNRSRVFDPFFTTERATGGTGMGLTIVANMLRAHGGAIRLADTDGGTCFEISFGAGAQA